MKRPINLLFRHAIFAISVLLASYASLLPHETVESDIPANVQAFDLVFHMGAYFVVTFTAMLALARERLDAATRLNFFLGATLFGAVLEILQATLPGVARTCTLSDFFSNMAGAALAAALTPSDWIIVRKQRPEVS
ncbi:MAG: VanZ family protein [Kiritimatiellia bacterium]|jgi:VanZ family protein